MSVVANVAINVDSRDAAAKLRQFQQQSTAAGRAAEQLQHGTTAAGQAAQGAGRQFQAAANGLKYYIDATGRARKENGQFVSTAEAAAAGLRRQSQAAQGASTAVKGLTAALGTLLPALAVADLGRRFFAGFNEAEKAAAAVRTLGVDSNELNQRLLGVSISLGGLYSQTQLLTAAYDVASSGFANAADNAKILEAAANGATGGLSDINTVGNAVTSVLNAYGKSADEAANLVDGFIQTQNDGKIVLNEYAQQIGRLAPTAAAAGVGITELNAAVATITAQGVPVEATFTGLNQALVSILKPSQEATELAKELGIDFNEAGLRAKGFGGLLEEVKQKTGGSTTALVKLFGSVDALKAILPLVNDDLVKYNQNLGKQAQVSGVAEKAAQELGSTVSGEITKLINGIGNLARTVDSVLGPAIKAVLNEALFAINTINQLLNTGARARSFGLDQQGRKRILNQAQQEAEDIVTRRRIADPFERNRQFQEIAAQRERDLIEAYGMRTGQIKPQAVAPARPAAAGADPRIQSVLAGMEGGRSGGRGRSGGKSEADKVARAAEQLNQQTAQQLQAAKDLQFTQANQLLQLRAKNDFERTFVEFGIKRSEIERKYNELLQQSKSAEETKLLQQARAAEYKQSSLILEQRSIELTKQASQPLDDILKNLQDQAAYQREYGELIKNGTNPELAKQIIEINRAHEASVAALEPAIAAAQAAVTKAEAEGVSATQIEKYRKELERIQEIRGGLEGKRGQAIGAAKEGAAKQPTVLDGIGERIKQLQAELNPVKVATDSIVSGADAIGQAFGQAFQDVATGAKSTQEALADAFKGIGQAFISMAAEIIAKQLAMIALQTILKALGGGGGFSFSGAGPAKLPSGGGFAEGFLMEGPGFTPRANGGPVTSGSPYIVGERGPELFVPSSSGSVMSNADTRAMLNQQTAARQANATGMALHQKPIDVRYESTVINQTEYVTAEQHRKGLAQAAERGRALTLAALQNSTRTRKKVGI